MARPDQPEPPQQRQPPRLYGREDALGKLTAAYDRVLHTDTLAVVAVRGEGGSGKTALLDRFEHQLTRGDGDTPPRVARGEATSLPEPYRPVRDALRRLLAAEARRSRAAGRRLVELFRAAAPYWLGAIPGIGGLLEGLAVGADAALKEPAGPFVDGEFDQLTLLLRKLSGERPLVLVLDDLQRADDGTAGLLQAVTHELRGDAVRLLIVAAWRAGESGTSATLPVERAVRDLARDIHQEDVELGRLDEPEVAAIATDLVGVPPTGAVARWLLRRSEGVPLAVEELVRELRERAGPDPDEWTPSRLDAVAPQLVELHGMRSVLTARLDGLGKDQHGRDQQRLLSVAAVIGPVFRALTLTEFGDLTGVTDSTEAGVSRVLRSLRQHGLIEPAETVSLDAYRFCHNLLREHLLEQLRADPWDYTRLHLRAATLLESRPDPDAEQDRWAELAYHYREAGRIDAALATLARACEAAYDNTTWREGVRHLAERVLDWLGPDGDPALRSRALLAVAEASQALQKFPAAVEAATGARALAEAAADAWSLAGALVVLASVEAGDNADYGKLELLDRATALYRHAASDEGAGDDSTGDRVLPRLLQAWYTTTWLAMRLSDWEASGQALATAEQTLHALGEVLAGDAAGSAGKGSLLAGRRSWEDPWRWRARLAQLHGEALAQQGRWAAALEPLAEARRLCVARRDLLGEAAAGGWYGLALFRTGRQDEGFDEIHAALAIERDHLASREGAAKWLHQLGVLHAERGELELAAETLWLARDLLRDLGHAAATGTADVLRIVRDRLGHAEYARLRAGFDPAASRYAKFAFVWRLPVFGKPAPPALEPRGAGWESLAVLNPAAYSDGETVVLLYRAVGPADGGIGRGGTGEVSSIGLAFSTDGLAFRREPDPVVAITKEFERPGGCEDPRLVRLSDGDDGHALTYNGYDGTVSRAAIAFSADLRHWNKDGPVFDAAAELDRREHAPVPPGTPRNWAKSAALLPEPIDGRWWLYFGDTHIWAAHSRDLRHWRVVPRPVLSPRPGHFDAHLVEPGPPPLLRPDGILLIYNGADDGLRYAVGQALMSHHDPTRVLARAPEPLLTVTEPAETHGRVPNVVFATGLVCRNDTWYLYYGMADTRVGVAVTHPHDPSTASSRPRSATDRGPSARRRNARNRTPDQAEFRYQAP